MLGGINVVVTGPCYDPRTTRLVCSFGFEEGLPNGGVVINEIRAVCTLPMMRETGTIIVAASTNGGTDLDFSGTFTSCEL